MPFEQETNLLDLPNQYINFEAEFMVSCGLPNSKELLLYLEPYLRKWVENNDSVHQFATKYADVGLSLWTASRVPVTGEGKTYQATCFYLVSEQQEKGYVLIHCCLFHKEQLH